MDYNTQDHGRVTGMEDLIQLHHPLLPESSLAYGSFFSESGCRKVGPEVWLWPGILGDFLSLSHNDAI
jgi:hypothetical protein